MHTEQIKVNGHLPGFAAHHAVSNGDALYGTGPNETLHICLVFKFPPLGDIQQT